LKSTHVSSSTPDTGRPGDDGSSAGGDQPRAKRGSAVRALGLGVITGAADDDPSAIGTYASAGAKFGFAFLWMAPVTMPMMFTVVYLSSKLAMVSGRGLFHAIRDFYPRWVLYPLLFGVLVGNTIEAAADLGGMAAALNIFLPVPIPWLVAGIAAIVLALQCLASYDTIRNVFRWLALALLTYVGAALLAQPDLAGALKGTFLPHIEFTQEYLSLVVAVIGTTLSAYLYTWQSNQEVEEEVAQGRATVAQRKGASRTELRESRRDILIGMIFSNLIMYFIIMATGATLHASGKTDIETAAQAAQALTPIAGDAAGLLFAAGIVGVGFLAVPVMTTGAAYDVAQALGWKHGLHARVRDAKKFYACIAAFTAVAVGLNFLGFNPMKALVWSGVVQGFSVPPLLLVIMLITNNRKVMGAQVNSRALNVAGWLTTAAATLATVGLVITWLR
jgi:NRAMP (natural resistance-associated macrophage protein)-like metal ion transporter